ncbi:MAG: hypothetical protein WCO09_03875 [bacterium]
MNEKFKELLNELDTKDLAMPTNLVKNIILRVDKKAHNGARLKAFGLGLVSISSFLVSIPIISQIITSFTQSGFYNYLSIVFSDSDVAIIYWKEILMSLTDSLPTVAITGLLAVAIIFVWSTLKATSFAKNSLITA